MSGTDNYAVFGNPVKHSKSPLIHSAFARQTGQSLQYRAVRVDEPDFVRRTRAFFDEGGCGLNITVPFKQQAYEFADEPSAAALRAGAVNTLSRRADGTIAGDNTDGVGLVRDLLANLGWQLEGARVLLLGAGGAARGVVEPLLQSQPGELLILNRTAEKARDLASAFASFGTVSGAGFPDLDEQRFDIVINATSASLAGELPPLPGQLLSERGCCYDMMYSAQPTVFMRWAAQNAAWAVSDGLGMLVEQAAESFYLWRGQRPDTAPVIADLRLALDS
jgi:shikimate dehydrogenase